MEEQVDYRKTPAASPLGTERTRNRRVYAPKVDIIETTDGMVLYADVPGADEKSVEVTVEKNVLSIAAKVEPQEFTGRSVRYAEYDVGDYERAFTISEEVDRDRIEAVAKNGVLKIVLYRAPEAGVKKISVRAE